MARMTFEERKARAFRLGLIHGPIAFVMLIVFVFATGSTFGQRCDRMHPNDPIARDACVERLVSGEDR